MKWIMPRPRGRLVAVSIPLFLSGCLAVLIFATSLVAPPSGEGTIFRVPECKGLKATVWGRDLVGTGGRDVIVGDGRSNNIRALGGHDLICGGGGGDKIYGFAGNDDIYGGDGDDYVNADKGDDFVAGEDGADDLHGKQGHDLVFGGDGKDEVLGGDDGDELSGGAGNDHLLDRSADRNSLLGDAGKDFIRGGPRPDVIRGGAGNDDADGGDGADKIEGNGGRDELAGGKGNDTVKGGEDNDLLTGDAGKDTLRGGGGTDRCGGGSGADVCDGGLPHPADRSTDPDICQDDVETQRSCRESSSFPRAYTGHGSVTRDFRPGPEDRSTETWTWSGVTITDEDGDFRYDGYGTGTYEISGTDRNCTYEGSASGPVYAQLKWGRPDSPTDPYEYDFYIQPEFTFKRTTTCTDPRDGSKSVEVVEDNVPTFFPGQGPFTAKNPNENVSGSWSRGGSYAEEYSWSFVPQD